MESFLNLILAGLLGFLLGFLSIAVLYFILRVVSLTKIINKENKRRFKLEHYLKQRFSGMVRHTINVPAHDLGRYIELLKFERVKALDRFFVTLTLLSMTILIINVG